MKLNTSIFIANNSEAMTEARYKALKAILGL